MSLLLDRVVEELSKLPSVGERSALRLALHILKQPKDRIETLVCAIDDFRVNIRYCSCCNNLSDSDLCPICLDIGRDRTTVCVVENIKDVMSIEATQMYNGLYHVLGGVISPMSGVSPSQLKIDLLIENIQNNFVKEVILALNTSIEAETTMFYIMRRLGSIDVKISNISRGIGFGDELDYADEMTIVHAIKNRIEIK